MTCRPIILLLLVPATCFAQGNNNNNNAGGILIDARGVVTAALQHDATGKLDQKRKAALVRQALPGDVSTPSELRMVSLVKLEAACTALCREGQPLTPDLQFMAGLTRIDLVLIDPETNDLIVAGPAEPFARLESGRVIGLESSRPVLRLDDLLVALRTRTDQSIGCSIDPVPERMARMQQFLRQNNGPADQQQIEQRFRQLPELLGNHRVRIMGVPEDTHFARGLLEADYRMKLLALGLENPGVKGFRSSLSYTGQGNSVQRWWFVPLYDRIVKTDDDLAYEWSGQRAQLLGEDELPNGDGQLLKSATQKVSTQEFARQFTGKFPQLAAKLPVFAELQQLIDWTTLAALIRQERLAERCDWKMTQFLDAELLPHEVWPVPHETKCVMNTRVTGSGVMVAQLSGGVILRANEVVRHIAVSRDPDLPARRRRAITHTPAPSHIWWWD